MAEEAELVAYWGREQRLAALEETLADADIQTQSLLALAEEDSPQLLERRRSLRVWRGGLGLAVALVAFVALTLLAAPQAREVLAAVIHEAVKHTPAPVTVANAAPSDPLPRRDTPTVQRASRGPAASQVPTSSAVSQPSQRGPAAAGPLLSSLPVASVPPQVASTPSPPPSPSGSNQGDSGLPTSAPSDGLPPGLANRASLPPGLAKKKELPPGLAKKVLPTPTLSP